MPMTLPTLKCVECKKPFVVVQPWIEIQLGIPPNPPQTCEEHEQEED